MRIKDLRNKLRQFFTDSEIRVCYLTELGLLNWMPDEWLLRYKFYSCMGEKLHLKDPKTFNEKLQWLKLYNRRPEYTAMVDKYLVRSFVAQTIGEQYLIPLLGVWDDPEKIPFEVLPNQFVLKCNHNSGNGMCICKDKQLLDVEKVKRELSAGLKENYFIKNREWPYKDVPRKIICEKYMQDDSGTGELSDYKVLCFNGEPKLVEVHHGRFGGIHTQDFYDVQWNKTDISQPGEPMSDEVMTKPPFAEKMFSLTRALAKGMPHVRIDWYYTGGRLYFGEITFFDGAGLCPFNGDWDAVLGSWIDLTQVPKT